MQTAPSTNQEIYTAAHSDALVPRNLTKEEVTAIHEEIARKILRGTLTVQEVSFQLAMARTVDPEKNLDLSIIDALCQRDGLVTGKVAAWWIGVSPGRFRVAAKEWGLVADSHDTDGSALYKRDQVERVIAMKK